MAELRNECVGVSAENRLRCTRSDRETGVAGSSQVDAVLRIHGDCRRVRTAILPGNPAKIGRPPVARRAMRTGWYQRC